MCRGDQESRVFSILDAIRIHLDLHVASYLLHPPKIENTHLGNVRIFQLIDNLRLLCFKGLEVFIEEFGIDTEVGAESMVSLSDDVERRRCKLGCIV